MKIKILSVFGTRPEAIKMAPLIKKMAENARFDSKICVTGQHQEMLQSVLELFHITPDFNLQVMEKNQDLSHLTAKILLGMQGVLVHYHPDLILVHGDTTTTLVASLSAYYHRIPVAHVEAGLRSGNMMLPWPEEANRKLVGALSILHFAPTIGAKQNLLNEGVSEECIHVTGNTVIDTLLDTLQILDKNTHLMREYKQQFSFLDSSRRMILVTGHRRENFGGGFERMCDALRLIAKRFPEVDIVYPVHLNPQVQEPVNKLLSEIKNIYLIPPVDYLAFVYFMKNAYFILTDSGGVQEEAPSLGTPVLVMRDKTERPEAIEAGTVELVGTSVSKIVTHVERLLMDSSHYQRMSAANNPYGDGMASDRILSAIAAWFEKNRKQEMTGNLIKEVV